MVKDTLINFLWIAVGAWCFFSIFLSETSFLAYLGTILTDYFSFFRTEEKKWNEVDGVFLFAYALCISFASEECMAELRNVPNTTGVDADFCDSLFGNAKDCIDNQNFC